METADAIANVLDTGLAAKETIDQLTIYRDELQLIVGQGTKGGQYPLDLTGKVRHTVDVLERINKLYAKFQMVSAGIDLLTEARPRTRRGTRASLQWARWSAPAARCSTPRPASRSTATSTSAR